MRYLFTFLPLILSIVPGFAFPVQHGGIGVFTERTLKDLL